MCMTLNPITSRAKASCYQFDCTVWSRKNGQPDRAFLETATRSWFLFVDYTPFWSTTSRPKKKWYSIMQRGMGWDGQVSEWVNNDAHFRNGPLTATVTATCAASKCKCMYECACIYIGIYTCTRFNLNRIISLWMPLSWCDGWYEDPYV